MPKDYEVCFIGGNVTFIKEAEFHEGCLIGKSVDTDLQLIAYVANCLYILELSCAKDELKKRRG